MTDNETKDETSVGKMRKNREAMADGRSYIIYYTFENADKIISETKLNDLNPEPEERENV
jgi:hypothetical protein